MRSGVLLCIGFCAALTLTAVKADVEVNVRQDKVILTDGTEIKCIILIITERAVVIVENDPNDSEVRHQRTIPRSVVQRIERGENEGVTADMSTESLLARKVIGGSAQDEPKVKEAHEPKEKKHEKKDPNDKTVAEKKPVKHEAKGGPVGPDKAGIVYSGKAAKLATGTTAGGIKGAPKDMAEAYLQRFPALRDAADSFLGAERLPQAFEQIQKGDGAARTQAESFLNVFMGGDTSALGQTISSGGAGVTRPGRGDRTPKRTPKDKPAAGQ